MFRISSSGLRVSVFAFRVSGFVFRASRFKFQISGFGFPISGFGIRVYRGGGRPVGLGVFSGGPEREGVGSACARCTHRRDFQVPAFRILRRPPVCTDQFLGYEPSPYKLKSPPDTRFPGPLSPAYERVLVRL